MNRLLLVPLLLLALVSSAMAQESTVRSFYQAYMAAVEEHPQAWVQHLMQVQADNVESDLSSMLVRLANGKPGTEEPWLDFDPFSNSQMGTQSYTVGKATLKDGLAYVPVAIAYYRDTGPEKVRVRVVLRQTGSVWKIANFVYPADAGMATWDLKSFLKQTLQP